MTRTLNGRCARLAPPLVLAPLLLLALLLLASVPGVSARCVFPPPTQPPDAWRLSRGGDVLVTPDEPAHSQLGVAAQFYGWHGRVQDAIACYEAAIEHTPAGERIAGAYWLNLAVELSALLRAQRASGDISAARVCDAFDRAALADASLLGAWLGAMRMRRERGDCPAALAVFDEYAQHQAAGFVDPSASLEAALCLHTLGDARRAIDVLRDALERAESGAGDDVDAVAALLWMNLGSVYSDVGERDAALACTGVAAARGHVAARMNYALMLVSHERFLEALEFLPAALDTALGCEAGGSADGDAVASIGADVMRDLRDRLTSSFLHASRMACSWTHWGDWLEPAAAALLCADGAALARAWCGARRATSAALGVASAAQREQWVRPSCELSRGARALVEAAHSVADVAARWCVPAARGQLGVQLDAALAAMAAHRVDADVLDAQPFRAMPWSQAGKRLRRVGELAAAERLAQLALAHWHQRSGGAGEGGDVLPAPCGRTVADAARDVRRRGGVLRVGFMSSDMRMHTLGFLVQELLRLLTASRRVEVYAYSLAPDDGSNRRRRMAASVTRFVECHALDAAALAALVCADGVDVLVDLNGYTEGARTEVFVRGAAPLQLLHGVGYPGTMGGAALTLHSHFVGDRVVTAPDTQLEFGERLVLLPTTYQPNPHVGASARAAADGVAPRTFTRASLGLPETHEAVVLCALNQLYKVSPRDVDVWARVLRAHASGTVLWLLRYPPDAEANLRREFAARGVADVERRVVFADRQPRVYYNDMIAHCDLFLDATGGVGAHSTATDALFVGVPLLTVRGHSIASRIAPALVQFALGDPDDTVSQAGASARALSRVFIASSLAEYEARAFQLVGEAVRALGAGGAAAGAATVLQRMREALRRGAVDAADGRTPPAPLYDTAAQARATHSALLLLFDSEHVLAARRAHARAAAAGAVDELGVDALCEHPRARQHHHVVVGRRPAGR